MLNYQLTLTTFEYKLERMNRYSDKSGSHIIKDYIIDERTLETIRREMVSRQTAESIADVFKIMGDPSRVKIIYSLLQADLCVSDLADVVGISQSAVSHQLRLLRNFRLVKSRRTGRKIFYSLNDHHIINLLSECLEHIKE